jgi:hypothetical protein
MKQKKHRASRYLMVEAVMADAEADPLSVRGQLLRLRASLPDQSSTPTKDPVQSS